MLGAARLPRDEVVGEPPARYRVAEEIWGTPRVIATGGFASLIAPEARTIEAVDEFLTLASRMFTAFSFSDHINARDRSDL
jgi:hypothetical protein